MLENVTEEQIAKTARAPRVTPQDIASVIHSEKFFTHDLLTLCVLTLANGFSVTGESACADPANYNKELGERLARKDAQNKIWSLLGYELKTKVALINAATPATDPSFTTYVGTKVVHAKEMTRGEYNTLRGWVVPENENADDEGYILEYGDGGEANTPFLKGYVSWSPRNIFERNYGALNVKPAEPTGFLDSMILERAELKDKTTKLGEFMEGAIYPILSSDERLMLTEQHSAMSAYQKALNDRLTFYK